MRASGNAVRIVEMGPRDGLQNEKQTVPLATKLELIDRLGHGRPARDRSHLLRVAEVGAADGRPRRLDAHAAAPRGCDAIRC